MASWLRAQKRIPSCPRATGAQRWFWAYVSLTLTSSVAFAQNLVIESWRKDDQIFWDKVLIPAFQRKHPGIRLSFKAEEPLAYDTRL